MSTISHSGKITPCLWFNSQAEEATEFYTSIFPDSEVLNVTRFGKEGKEFHQKEEGTVMTVVFRIGGLTFTGLNGGPLFNFTEAISFQVSCEGQEETDYYWNKLSEGGMESSCGWLKDKFGLSWQIIPKEFITFMSDPDPIRSQRVMKAMFPMKKIIIADLEKAYKG